MKEEYHPPVPDASTNVPFKRGDVVIYHTTTQGRWKNLNGQIGVIFHVDDTDKQFPYWIHWMTNMHAELGAEIGGWTLGQTERGWSDTVLELVGHIDLPPAEPNSGQEG